MKAIRELRFMILTGIVKGTTIEVTSGGPLPEGAIVRLDATVDPGASANSVPTDGYALNRDLLELAGTVEDLPADASKQLDHYLYGLPKR